MVNAASRWSPADYAKNAAFVPALGAAVLELLAPQAGERILDVGCGDGVLTRKIAAAGAIVVGLDSAPAMVEAACARGIDAFVADAETIDLARFGQFDAVFSNAALHWMLNPETVAVRVFAVLRNGGRFVGEMGGEGNLKELRRALRDELIGRGYVMPEADPSWYPSIDAFTRVYAKAGFCEVRAQLIDRPTVLPGGVAEWVKTFRAGVLDVAGVAEGERDAIAAAVEARVAPALRRADGTFFADYVRLRFTMNKPG